MIIVVGALLVAVVTPFVGGHVGNLGRVRIRGAWLVALALGVQIAVISVFDLPDWLSRALHLSTYAVLAAFVVANRHIPWMWLIGLGLLLNAVVITANGGVMPASAAALRAAGKELQDGFNNSDVVDDARLRWLGDVFHTPPWMPFANVFSIGDVLLMAGLALVVYAVTRADPVAPSAFLRPAGPAD